MVHLSEIRIVMPFTVEEFKRGQRYGNWKTNENAQEPGQGGTLLSSTPYYHEVYGEGMFTHSLFRLGNRLPDWVSALCRRCTIVLWSLLRRVTASRCHCIPVFLCVIGSLCLVLP